MVSTHHLVWVLLALVCVLMLLPGCADEPRITSVSVVDFCDAADVVEWATDDGSYGFHGFVTQKLQGLIDQGTKIDFVLAIGPIPMMKAVADVTRPHNIKTVISLNPIMVDGTGMCGACRVSVGGETKFVCVDGPEFDAHKVDFDEMLLRLNAYKTEESAAYQAYLNKIN